MKLQKFAIFDKDEQQIIKTMTIKELATSAPVPISDNLTFLQYTGINDHDGREIYEGDVLCLDITDDLLDPKKDSFYNSNFGKYITEQKSNGVNITQAYISFAYDQKYMQSIATVYLAKDNLIERNPRGKLDKACEDTNYFAAYLCSKGAVVIGNLLEDPDILERKAINIKDMENAKAYNDLIFLKDDGTYVIYNQSNQHIGIVRLSHSAQNIECYAGNSYGLPVYKTNLPENSIDDNYDIDEKEEEFHLQKIADIITKRESKGE